MLQAIIPSPPSNREREKLADYKSFAPAATTMDANSSQFDKIFYRERKTSAALMRYGR
jgi:hypothetical protein